MALSGAHTLGRVYPDRSGFGKASTKYTVSTPRPRSRPRQGQRHAGHEAWPGCSMVDGTAAV